MSSMWLGAITGIVLPLAGFIAGSVVTWLTLRAHGSLPRGYTAHPLGPIVGTPVPPGEETL